MSIKEYKRDLLDSLHSHLEKPVKELALGSSTHQQKATEVNSLITAAINREREVLLSKKAIIAIRDLQARLLVLEYVASVVSLEYRHSVWAYEYMALSRRVGELWERFCSAAWDCPSRSGVSRFIAPSFEKVRTEIQSHLLQLLSDRAPEVKDEILDAVYPLFDLVGDINMKEDEVFEVDGIPHVVDFKSGFGSNEKGNTMRLLTVGRAYKLWKPETRLLLLVRQKDNNNYLNLIRNSGLWEVHCGDAAYKKIDELTGAMTTAMRSEIFNFPVDLSDKFLQDLNSQLPNLASYLEW